jgi:hypothetical protein
MVSLHSRNIQRSHSNGLVLAHNSKIEFVQEIIALVCYLLMTPGKFLNCFLQILSSLLGLKV